MIVVPYTLLHSVQTVIAQTDMPWLSNDASKWVAPILGVCIILLTGNVRLTLGKMEGTISGIIPRLDDHSQSIRENLSEIRNNRERIRVLEATRKDVSEIKDRVETGFEEVFRQLGTLERQQEEMMRDIHEGVDKT